MSTSPISGQSLARLADLVRRAQSQGAAPRRAAAPASVTGVAHNGGLPPNQSVEAALRSQAGRDTAVATRALIEHLLAPQFPSAVRTHASFQRVVDEVVQALARDGAASTEIERLLKELLG